MQNRATLGIVYLCVGILVFSVQDATIKAVSGSYPLTQVLSIRCMIAMPILLLIVYFEAGLGSIFAIDVLPMLGRSLLLLLAYTSYYMAFPALPLADAVALYFTVPLFAMAMAAPLLGEKIGWRRISAVVIGFAGVVVMLRPGAGLFEPAALLSLFAAVTYALAMLMGRMMGVQTTASVMSFYQTAIYLVGALSLAAILGLLGVHEAVHPSLKFLVRPWVMPPLWDFLLIASCGVTAAIGMLMLTHAYRIAKASVVTSFEYTGMLWAPLWGFLFFNEIPHAATIGGAVLIIAAGLFALSSPSAREDRAEA